MVQKLDWVGSGSLRDGGAADRLDSTSNSEGGREEGRGETFRGEGTSELSYGCAWWVSQCVTRVYWAISGGNRATLVGESMMHCR